MEKPDILYHASPDRNIVRFEPRNESPRYEGEKNLVFATPHKEVAAMFLIPRSIPVEICKYDDSFVVFANCTEGDFRSQDIGGAIYAVPSDTFWMDESIGMGTAEWVSERTVTPISKVIYDTAIKALEENQVSIYYLDNDTFTRLRADPSHGLEIIQRPL